MNAIVKDLTRDSFAPAVELTEKEKRRYSLLRALRAQISGNWSKAGFELEVSRALAGPLNKEVRGVMVPFDVLRAPPMGTDKPGEGQEITAQTPRGDVWQSTVERATSFIDRATWLTDLVGDVVVPVTQSERQAEWIAEGADTSPDSQTTQSIRLSPKQAVGRLDVSRLLMRQSSPSVDAMLRSQMELTMRNHLDNALFVGAGGAEPLGIFNHPDIQEAAITATWADIVNMTQNPMYGPFQIGTRLDNLSSSAWFAYAMSPTFLLTCQQTERAAGSGFIVEGNTCNGYPCLPRTVMVFAGKSVCFGDFTRVLVGVWGGLDIVARQDATAAANGGYAVYAHMDMDVAVWATDAFFRSTA